MKNRLPSIGGLQAFEASARHLSFTRAAGELNLTQTAISHQIKSLEQYLGAQLFVRDRTGIKLTDVGRDYLEAISPSLFQIAAATERTFESNQESVLAVASLGTYAIKCLLPELHSFRRRYPEISLRLLTIDAFEHLPPNSYDIGIRYGIGDWPRMNAVRLTQEEVFPVCGPKLLEAGPRLEHPEDLRWHTGIRTESPVLHDFWPLWLEAAGIKDLVFADEIRCNRMTTSLQAAADGIGVTIARRSIVQSDLESGVLIEPFGIRLPAEAEGYYVVVPQDRAASRKVRAFQSWILETLGQCGEAGAED